MIGDRKTSARPARQAEKLAPPVEVGAIVRRYKRHLASVASGKREVADPDATVRQARRPERPPRLSEARQVQRPERPSDLFAGHQNSGLRLPETDDDDDDDS